MLEKYDEFSANKKNIENKKKNAKRIIDFEKKKIAGLNKKKLDNNIKKMTNQKREIQKTSNNDVGGSNYYK